MQIKVKIGQHSLIIIIDYPVAGFKVSENNFLSLSWTPAKIVSRDKSSSENWGDGKKKEEKIAAGNRQSHIKVGPQLVIN